MAQTDKMTTEDQLILVDEQDRQVGTCGKMEAHERALLHRAFSIFVFSAQRLLIQKRAAGKYHCAGIWANSCCSHPRDGEELHEAVHRRLPEETGIIVGQDGAVTEETGISVGRGDIAVPELREAGSFIYKAEFDNGLTEHELDHVFVGEMSPEDAAKYDGTAMRNPEEADEMLFVDIDWLQQDMKSAPEKYAPWFIKALPIALDAR